MVKITNLRLVTDPHKKSRYDAKESCEFISLQSQSISESREKSFHDKETKSLIFQPLRLGRVRNQGIYPRASWKPVQGE